MMNSTEDLRRLYWTIGLILTLPLFTVLFVEAEQYFRRRGSKYHSVIRYLRILFMPLLAAWLMLTQIMGYPVEADLPKLLATLAGVSGIVVGLTLVNAILFDNVEANSWQSRTPKLLVDIVRLFLVVVGAAIVLSMVWGVDLGQLAAALGIGSIVIGLAIAEPLGNVFAGLMLLVERPIAVGDWIKIGDHIGQVIEINWRAIHLRTFQLELVVVPNAILAKESFSNFSRPTRLHSESLTLGFSYDDAPNKVRAMLHDLLESTPGILHEPPPLVRVMNYGDFSVDYRVIFFVEDFLSLGKARDAFMTKVWYAVKREGITIPFPTAVEYSAEEKRDFLDTDGKPPIAESLNEHSIMAGLSENQKKLVDKGSFRRSYAKEEVIVDQGESIDGLFLIDGGRVRVSHKQLDGTWRDLYEAAKGDVFGESVANGNRTSESRVMALQDTECIVVRPETLREILVTAPRFAREISQITEMRKTEKGQPMAEDLLASLFAGNAGSKRAPAGRASAPIPGNRSR